MMTNFHLNTTVVAIFPNVCLWRRSLCSDLVLTLKNRIEPPSYARTAYVVAIWPSFLFDSFVKIWATCEIFLGKWFTAPLAKNFPYAYVVITWQWKRRIPILWIARVLYFHLCSHVTTSFECWTCDHHNNQPGLHAFFIGCSIHHISSVCLGKTSK